eukprot:Skav215127  [mRNA]  locus=scaffold1164:28998:33055:- [translate_table: standard]
MAKALRNFSACPGVLAMGDAVAKLGWCLGALLILVMLVLVAVAQYGSIFLSLGLYSLSIGQGSTGIEVTRLQTSRVVAFERPEAFGVFSAVSTLAAEQEKSGIASWILLDFPEKNKQVGRIEHSKIQKVPVEVPVEVPFEVPFEVRYPGTVAFALQGHTIIVEILAETRSDLIPFGAYNQLAALCMLTHMVITYVINSVVLGSKVDKWLQPSVGYLSWPVAVLLIVFSSYLTAQVQLKQSETE